MQPPQPEQQKWHKDVKVPFFTGRLFVDGSGDLCKYCPKMARCGWAVVQMDETECVAALYGNMEGDDQTVPRAELTAIRHTLEHAMPPFTIYQLFLSSIYAYF